MMHSDGDRKDGGGGDLHHQKHSRKKQIYILK
jgi:hypothetical protein